MYKNIIFDFGGVVVNFNPRDFLMDHFMNRRAEEETYDIVFGSQEWQDLDRGIITREEANKIMLEKAAHANRVFEVQTCLDEGFTMLETNKTTVQIMRKLKAAGYRLYYLTNIPTDVMDELRQREWFSLFDGGIASCDVHLCKPEPEIFTTLMQTCHLRARGGIAECKTAVRMGCRFCVQRMQGRALFARRSCAAVAKLPGGYGIRPYVVGVDARHRPGRYVLPQGFSGRTMFAPTKHF